MVLSDSVDTIPDTPRTGDQIGGYTFSDLKDGVIKNFSSGLDEIYALQRRIELDTNNFFVPSRPTTSTTTTTTEAPTKITKTCAGCLKEHELNIFRNEPWVVPLLTISGVLLSFIICFELYVLMKATKTTPSRRHLFLGQMLLLGLFMCGTLGIIIAATPTPFTCAVVRFGTGVAYSVVFASLLVKCVFLISLNSGVYLPATYQSLLLLFAILIQIAIGVQWLITNPPEIQQYTFEVVSRQKHNLLVTADDVTKSIVIPLCQTPYSDIILSLIYVIFLIAFVSALAMKSRTIRSNYRESTYIGLAVLCCIPTWLVWTLSGFVVGERHKDACLGFGLAVTASITFLVMFMPKGRQLSATGKDGVYLEDREEGFSSISRAGSGYSPSFFHFKPPKYGFGTVTEKTLPTISSLQGMYINPEDNNMYTNLEHTMSSNPNVFFQSNNGVHPGMIY